MVRGRKKTVWQIADERDARRRRDYARRIKLAKAGKLKHKPIFPKRHPPLPTPMRLVKQNAEAVRARWRKNR